jgi:hypothetical protein
MVHRRPLEERDVESHRLERPAPGPVVQTLYPERVAARQDAGGPRHQRKAGQLRPVQAAGEADLAGQAASSPETDPAGRGLGDRGPLPAPLRVHQGEQQGRGHRRPEAPPRTGPDGAGAEPPGDNDKGAHRADRRLLRHRDQGHNHRRGQGNGRYGRPGHTVARGLPRAAGPDLRPGEGAAAERRLQRRQRPCRPVARGGRRDQHHVRVRPDLHKHPGPREDAGAGFGCLEQRAGQGAALPEAQPAVPLRTGFRVRQGARCQRRSRANRRRLQEPAAVERSRYSTRRSTLRARTTRAPSPCPTWPRRWARTSRR